MSDNAPGPRAVGEYLAILHAKKTRLCADIDAAEKGRRGGGRPRGFQAEGRTDQETGRRGLAWVQGRVDADFLLPSLRWLHQDLSRLGVVNLPPWTGEPQDETAALDLLNRMIHACEQTASSKLQQPTADLVYRALLCYAEENWKGDELKAVKVLCANNGSLALPDFALAMKWDCNNGRIDDGRWSSLQQRLNPKLRKQGWELRRQANHAQLRPSEAATKK